MGVWIVALSSIIFSSRVAGIGTPKALASEATCRRTRSSRRTNAAVTGNAHAFLVNPRPVRLSHQCLATRWHGKHDFRRMRRA